MAQKCGTRTNRSKNILHKKWEQEMRKLNGNEIEKLRTKKVINVFNNFEQLLNGVTDEQVKKDLAENNTPYNLFISPNTPGQEIYDMGNGYFMLINEQRFHKATQKYLVEQGLADKKYNFEHTTHIVKVVE